MPYNPDDKSITEEILIEAPVKTVWKVLTEITKWEEWNPFIIQSAGTVALDATIINTMVGDGKKMTFKPKIIVLEENKEFTWLGQLFFPGLFDGRHQFLLEENQGKTKFKQHEDFKGILSSIILKKIGHSTADNFRMMNEALKERVEGKK